ncbi:hypothetical protein O4H52_03245 [Sphingomonadaceae bacterium G21617-S1]|nr:hypothetical protein [Sphingomonadaceae bacterium G21617-S1]
MSVSQLPKGQLPDDYRRAAWLDPLTMQGLIGASLGGLCSYRALFRDDGVAKSIYELVLVPDVAEWLVRNATGDAARFAGYRLKDQEASRRACSPRWIVWRTRLALALFRLDWRWTVAWEYSLGLLDWSIRATLDGDPMPTPRDALASDMEHWDGD